MIRESHYDDAALLAIELGPPDVAVPDRQLANEWRARNKVQILARDESPNR